MRGEKNHMERSKRRSQDTAHSLSQLAALLIILAQVLLCKYSAALSGIPVPDILVMATCTDVVVYLVLVNLIFLLVQARTRSDEEALDMFFEFGNAFPSLDLQQNKVSSGKGSS